MNTPRRNNAQYRAAAEERYAHGSGEIVIDDDAKVARGVNEAGAYVQAWVWVYDSECAAD